MKRLLPVVSCLLLFLYTSDVFALTNEGVLNSVLEVFKNASASWGTIILGYAKKLFLSLLLISVVWTYGQLMFQSADIGAYFSETIKFFLFFGLFWWLLTNSIDIANSIVSSFGVIGSESIAGMTGQVDSDVVQNGSISLSGIVDIGFDIVSLTMDKSSKWMLLPNMVFAGVVLLVLAKIAANVLVMLAGSYLLLYGGIFILGFGGSRWTSEMAINYYKTVLGLGIRLFFMILIVGVGVKFMNDLWAQVDPSKEINLNEIAVLAVAAIVLLFLSETIPEQAALMVGAALGGGATGSLGNFIGAAKAGVAMAGAVASAGAAAGGAALAGAGGSYKAWKAAGQASKEVGGSRAGHIAGGVMSQVKGAVGKATGGKTADAIKNNANAQKPTNAFAVGANGKNTSSPNAMKNK